MAIAMTRRRTKELEGRGLLYVGSGVSGGEEGARYGPSLMPGGNPAAWPAIKPIFQVRTRNMIDGFIPYQYYALREMYLI